MSEGKSRRQLLTARWQGLKNERASWDTHWQEISDYLLPRAGRYFVQDRNLGGKRHNNIYDNSATRSLKVMAAGMMAGATSPARPWFRLMSPDAELNTFHSVRLWLDDAAKRMQRVFQKSNTYRTLHQLYEELGSFGTACTVILPDFASVIHHYPVTCGEYALAADYQGRVNTMFREFDITVGQMVREFGRDNVSETVRNLYDRGQLDDWRTIIHAIEPREDRDTSKGDPKNMPWSSCYFEVGTGHEAEDKLLRESGFMRFPVLAPRWTVTGGDIYGHSPGMEALGDIKQLQHEQLRKAQGIDYQTKPPLQAPTALQGRDVETLPGGVTFVDTTNPNAGIRPAWEVNLNLKDLREDIMDVRQRIQSSFYADLFLMLANAGPNTRMTATEVAERHEEKLLMLGPVLERLHNELLEPLVNLTFDVMMEGGLLPPPPEELQGMDLSVEFVSMLAQAQRAIGTNSVDRFVGNIGAIAQMKPEVLDKFDADEWVDSYSDMLGVDPRLIVADERVQELRSARNRALAAKEQAAAMEQQASTAQKLAASPTGPGQQNALTDIMSQFSGYNSPPATMV